jgi:hypothetical protein
MIYWMSQIASGLTEGATVPPGLINFIEERNNRHRKDVLGTFR